MSSGPRPDGTYPSVLSIDVLWIGDLEEEFVIEDFYLQMNL